MVSFSIRPSSGGQLATARAGSALGMTLPTLRKYGIAASYRKVGAALPYDAEVEYLQSTGTQWIETPIFVSYDRSFEIKLKAQIINNSRNVLFSDFQNDDNRPHLSLEIGGTANSKPYWTRAYYQPRPSAVDIWLAQHAINEVVQISATYDLATRRVHTTDGTASNTTTLGTRIAAQNKPLAMFLDWRDSKNAIQNPARLLSVYMKHGEDSWDFIPVRFTNEQGVSEGAMYDKSGTGGMNPDGSPRTDGLYRNRGTGAFSWGNDVAAVPSSETIQCVVPGKWSIDTPSFTNRRFMGWFTAPNDPFDESGATPAGAREIINGSAMDLPLPETVYACWQHKATVTFDANRSGAVVEYAPELYVGDGAGYAGSATISQGAGDEASFMGWSLNVRYPASSVRMDVDPYSVPGGVYYGMSGAIATGDVFYGLWLLPAQVAFDANLSSVSGVFSPQVDPYRPTYYDGYTYHELPAVYDDASRPDIRFAFWSKDTTPPCSYDPYDGMITSVDPTMDVAYNGETLYAVWQKAVGVRLMDGVDDPVMYVFEGEQIMSLPDPSQTPAGAVFDGWEDAYQMKDVHVGDPVYSSYIGNNPSYPDDWTLTPKWAYAVSVTFDATTNGGSMPSGWVPPAYYSGRPYGTLPTPTHPTLSFAGWYDGQMRITASSIVPAVGANLVAQYAQQSYSVDLNGEWRVVDPMDADASGETTPMELVGCDHFESASNYGVRPESQTYDPSTGSYVYTYNKSECASMTISVVGYSEFTIYVRASPSTYEYVDYIAVVLADNGIPQQPESDDDYWNGNIRIVQYSPPDDPYGYSYDVSDNPWYFINYGQWSAMVQETFQSQWGYESMRQAGVDTWPWVKYGLPSEDPPLDGSGVAVMTYDMVCQERLNQDYMGDVSQLDEYMARPPQGTVDGYIPVTVQLPDAGPHDIVVMYRKGVDDWSGDYYLSQYGTKDRGFVIIPTGGQPL